MSTKKQQASQQRQAKRSSQSRKRRGQYLHTKNIAKKIKKTITKEPVKTQSVPLKMKILNLLGIVIRKIKRFGCYVNIHDLKICSGREGDPMKTCIKCWKGSKEKWGAGGSEKHYEDKHLKGVDDPNNWKAGDGGWYFKGTWIDLDKTMMKKLNEIIGKPRMQEMKDNLKKEKRAEREKNQLEKLDKKDE